MDRVLIGGVNFTPSHNSQHFDLAMEEMVSLVKACDMEPVGRIEQNMESANTATYIGAGKAHAESVDKFFHFRLCFLIILFWFISFRIWL